MIKKGTQIVCPRCKFLIGVIAKDIHWGEMFVAGMIDYDTVKFQNGDKAKCPQCPEQWMNGSQFHTPEGWRP